MPLGDESSLAVCMTNASFCYQQGGQADANAFELFIPSLKITTGEKVALVGPSGSGKSTLLGLICGILVPQSGSVNVLGSELSTLSGGRRDRFRADHLGIIFQQFNLLPYLSVIDNVVLGMGFSRFGKLPAAEKQARAQSLLSALDIDVAQFGNRKVTGLSVGQQQRVAAARAFVAEPQLIVADEPTSALDEGRQGEFLDLLFAQQQKTGATLMLVTHDMRLASRFDRTIQLTDAIVQSKPPTQSADGQKEARA